MAQILPFPQRQQRPAIDTSYASLLRQFRSDYKAMLTDLKLERAKAQRLAAQLQAAKNNLRIANRIADNSAKSYYFKRMNGLWREWRELRAHTFATIWMLREVRECYNETLEIAQQSAS